MTHKNVLVREDNKSLHTCYKAAFDRYKDITYDLFDRGSKVLSALINNYYDIIVLDSKRQPMDKGEVRKVVRDMMSYSRDSRFKETNKNSFLKDDLFKIVDCVKSSLRGTTRIRGSGGRPPERPLTAKGGEV